jgi:hypothetical protein
MNNIIHGYDKTAFDNAALAHVDKLTFNTRSEYLAWVAQWKEDYRFISATRKISRLSRYTTAPKIERANKLIEKINAEFPPEKYTEIANRLTKQLEVEYGIKFTYWKPSTYNFIMYLLVARKASKLRAAKKREERLAAEKVAS